MNKKANLAIIGGTGLYDIEGFQKIESFNPVTPWGKPSDEIAICEWEGFRVAFLPRHGKGHYISPTNIPQKANIAALKMAGVEEIVAFSSVGSLKEEIAPGDFVIPAQIIDRTRHRDETFYNEGIVVHVSFGDPFDRELGDILSEAIKKEGIKIHKNETLVCMEGPAFSTRAESKLYRSWGAGIINMTVLPEAKLAREMEISYQMVCMSTDYDSWRESEEAVSADHIMKIVSKNTSAAKNIIRDVMPVFTKRGEKSSILKGSVKFGIMTSVERRNPDICNKLNMFLPGYF
ncbi:MAG: S-methyl-5'-thioadenosine phosphorylase [Spirochaetia bacterium]|nr:S-methyl-5'-thioadenosine phosphorylase [Spirochaetia bacterium]